MSSRSKDSAVILGGPKQLENISEAVNMSSEQRCAGTEIKVSMTDKRGIKGNWQREYYSLQSDDVTLLHATSQNIGQDDDDDDDDYICLCFISIHFGIIFELSIHPD